MSSLQVGHATVPLEEQDIAAQRACLPVAQLICPSERANFKSLAAARSKR
jgi:hypothetical protein